jgi:integrase/recombinase XerD
MSLFDSSKEHATSSLLRGNQRQKNGMTEARARVQKEKIDKQAQIRISQTENVAKQVKSKKTSLEGQIISQAVPTITDAIGLYLQDHEGGNHSPKTLEWHKTALGLLCSFLQEQRAITLVQEVEAADISAWLVYLRKVPSKRGKPRTERTIQTYARSARAFFYWLLRREMIEDSPFAHIAFPKVGRPLIQTITTEEFEKLLQACIPSHESDLLMERAVARNRAILFVFYDTGIRLSELCGLRQKDFDRKHGTLTVKGKGAKERRIALGQNCQRHLLHYLDRHRPSDEELAEWNSAGEDHLFLSETRRPLTKNGVEMLFKRLKARAGITGKRISPHILRRTFAVNYLIKSNDPFSLQELLGHEDIATVRIYMHMSDEILQQQKRKYSPGDLLVTQMQNVRGRRMAFIPKTKERKSLMDK